MKDDNSTLLPRYKGVTEAAGQQLLLTVDQAVQRTTIGRTRMFELIKSGEIRSVKIGRSRRIPVRALEEYVDTLLHGQKAA